MTIPQQQKLAENSHAIAIKGRLDVAKDGTIERILIVETDLELNAMKAGHDSAAVRQLAEDLMEALGDDFDRGEIVNR